MREIKINGISIANSHRGYLEEEMCYNIPLKMKNKKDENDTEVDKKESGSLYLTLGGFAFAKIEKYASAQEIAEKLNIARQNAIELEGVNDGC